MTVRVNGDPYGSSFSGDTGKRYEVITGTVQNNGSGVWQVIDNATHQPIGVASVSASTTAITVDFLRTAGQVVSFVCGVDETFAQNGYTCGASVGTSSAVISLVQLSRTVGCYVAWTGSGFTITGSTGGLAVSAFDGASGKLTLSHTSIPNTIASVSGRRTGYRPVLDSVGATTSEIYWTDDSGVVQTAGHTNMKAFFSRSATPALADPTTTDVAGANIWFYGVMEL